MKTHSTLCYTHTSSSSSSSVAHAGRRAASHANFVADVAKYLPPREAAHDSGLAEEPQEAQETNDGEGGGRVQQDLEEKYGTLLGALLCGGKRHLLAYLNFRGR